MTIDQTLGPDDPKVSTDYDKLGSAYLELLQFEDGRTAYRNALQTRISRLGRTIWMSPPVGSIWECSKTGTRGRWTRRPILKPALAISEGKLGPDAYGLTGILDRLGALDSSHESVKPLRECGGLAAALAGDSRKNSGSAAFGCRAGTGKSRLGVLLRQQISGSRTAVPAVTADPEGDERCEQPADRGGARSDRDQLLAQKRYSDAEPYFRQALTIHETKSIGTLTGLAQLYATTGDMKRSGDYFERAELIGLKGLGGDHPEIISTLESYAVMLRMANRMTDARKVDAQVKELKEKWPSAADAGTVVASVGAEGATGSTGARGATGRVPPRAPVAR